MMGLPFIFFVFKMLYYLFTIKSERNGDFKTQLKFNLSDLGKLMITQLGIIGALHTLIYSEFLSALGLKITDKTLLFGTLSGETLLVVSFSYIYIPIFEMFRRAVFRNIKRGNNKIKKNKKEIFKVIINTLSFGVLFSKVIKENVENIEKMIKDNKDIERTLPFNNEEKNLDLIKKNKKQ